jgi:hypothetical protein
MLRAAAWLCHIIRSGYSTVHITQQDIKTLLLWKFTEVHSCLDKESTIALIPLHMLTKSGDLPLALLIVEGEAVSILTIESDHIRWFPIAHQTCPTFTNRPQ